MSYIGGEIETKASINETYITYTFEQTASGVDENIYHHYKVIENFANAITHNTPIMTDGMQALSSLQFIENCYQKIYRIN